MITDETELAGDREKDDAKTSLRATNTLTARNKKTASVEHHHMTFEVVC